MAAMMTTIIIPTSTPNDVFFIFDFFICSCTVCPLVVSAEMLGTARYPIAPHRTMIKVDVRSATRLFRDFVFIYNMNEKFLLTP